MCNGNMHAVAAVAGIGMDMEESENMPKNICDATTSEKRREQHNLRPVPLGIDNYIKVSERYYYVDKTLLIRDILESGSEVTLITRPRRFGKSLNMDMLRVFFETTDEDTSVHFENKKIWEHEEFRQYQGAYPVVFLSLKDAAGRTWNTAYSRMVDILSVEFQRHQAMMTDKNRLPHPMQQMMEQCASKNVLTAEAQDALFHLTRILHEYYKHPALVLIDEYDAPILNGYSHGFYDEAEEFVCGMFSRALKSNPHLWMACLTGVTCIAQESLFSGLNNAEVDSVLDEPYRNYFGFTPEEVEEMAKYYDISVDKLEEIRSWYNGYDFAGQNIYNPWSVIKYFRNRCRAKPYWVRATGFDALRDALRRTDDATGDNLRNLLDGKSVLEEIIPEIVYPDLVQEESAVWTLLLMAGYLTTSGYVSEDTYELVIPNKEIRKVYRREILNILGDGKMSATFRLFATAVVTGKANLIQQALRDLLLKSASVFDTSESFYHGLVLGLCAAMEKYSVRSNRESGTGRYDICLFPRDTSDPGIIFEFKVPQKKGSESLDELAREVALAQIREKHYDTDLKDAGVLTVYRYGAAFKGKEVAVAGETDVT